jgi:cold shock CspA family protein
MRMRGTVVHWNARKQFGFVKHDDAPADSKDIFFGRHSINAGHDVQINRGDIVTYDMGECRKTGKPQAQNRYPITGNERIFPAVSRRCWTICPLQTLPHWLLMSGL